MVRINGVISVVPDRKYSIKVIIICKHIKDVKLIHSYLGKVLFFSQRLDFI